MTENTFHHLTKDNPYHIMVRSSPLSYPINFAIHTRIVLVTPEFTHRWEVHRKQRNDAKHREGYCYLNYQKPNSGQFKSLFKRGNTFTAKCLYHLQGDKKLLTTINHIEKIIQDYPYKHYYNLLGINSNSFTQYLLDQSGIDYKLPKNAFGKKTK